jgi:ABC-2 type transport system permease protein
MNMLFHEIKENSKFTMIWSCAISAWVILISLFYPTFSDNAAVIAKALASYPEAVRNLIGLSQDSLSSYFGFYTFVFNGVIEVGIIQAIILGASILFKEVSGKTADFLFSKPVTRKQIMTAKLCSAGVSLAITTLICFLVSSIIASTISSEDINLKVLFMVCITLLFVQLIFMSFGILISAVFPKIKSAAAIAIGALLLSEIIYSIFKPIIGENAVRYLIPIKYFKSEYIIKNASYEATFVLITIILIVVSVAANYVVYYKKDVHAA